MSIGGFDALLLPHEVPAPNKVGTIIVETNPLEFRDPRGIQRGSPFLHGRAAMRTFGGLFITHGFLLISVRIPI
jgi:hypothetical protein